MISSIICCLFKELKSINRKVRQGFRKDRKGLNGFGFTLCPLRKPWRS